jgi:hypothetical protein
VMVMEGRKAFTAVTHTRRANTREGSRTHGNQHDQGGDDQDSTSAMHVNCLSDRCCCCWVIMMATLECLSSIYNLPGKNPIQATLIPYRESLKQSILGSGAAMPSNAAYEPLRRTGNRLQMPMWQPSTQSRGCYYNRQNALTFIFIFQLLSFFAG